MKSPSLRLANIQDLPKVSDLCIRSKAHWGYSDAFMAACKSELTLTANDLACTQVAVAEAASGLIGMAQLGRSGRDADLLKLFVDPPWIGEGIGRLLFDWCVAEAQEMGAHQMLIESDPQAAPIYIAMGAREIGKVSSDSIKGRYLPLLSLQLKG